MPWSEDSIARSIRRHLALAFDGPPWTLRVERREVANEDRPVAVVDVGDSRITRARESVDQGEVELLMPVTVSAYPVVEANPRVGRREADRVRALLRGVLLHGFRGPTFEDGRPASGPFRVPLYDYSETPVEGAGRAGPEHPHDVIWIDPDSVEVSKVQDPDDPARFSVFAEFRVSVEAPGTVGPSDGTVSEVSGTYVA